MSEVGESAETAASGCGHPNHGAADHDCAPFNAETDARRCEVRYTTKGSPVRVNGNISHEHLDALGDAVERLMDSMCKALSPVPMPKIAQKIHGRETYWCGRPQGHRGSHRWPGVESDRAPVAEWSEPTTPPAQPTQPGTTP